MGHVNFYHSDFVDLSLSGNGEHTCGITSHNEIRCWGTGDSGQLGVMKLNYHSSLPQLVKQPTEEETGKSFDFDFFYRGYACGSNSSGCLQKGLTFSKGAGTSAGIEGESNLHIEDLESGHSLTVFEDASCTTSLNQGDLSGASSGDILVQNLIFGRRKELYFKESGNVLDIDCSHFYFAPVDAHWTVPQVTAIEFASSKRHFKAGDEMRFRVIFSEEVQITGMPYLHIILDLDSDASFAGTRVFWPKFMNLFTR